MARVALTDGSGSWFDDGVAVRFKEGVNWDGRNHISTPTGSQWNHECLYYTKTGKWVMNSWSDYQGTTESYEQITEGVAVKWMIQNWCFADKSMEDLPKVIRLAVLAGFAAAEI